MEVDGRAALKLTPTRRSVRLGSHSGVHELLGTVYVTPGTYDPIKEVLREPGLGVGFSSTLVESWLVYKVLPVTKATSELVSLSARHPRARVIHSGTGYLAASSSESKGSPIIRVTSH